MQLSLKFFFYRRGKVVVVLTLLGWGLTAVNWMIQKAGFLFILFTVINLLILLFRLIPWYAPSDRGRGIEQHYEKALVPAAYIMVATNAIFLLWQNCWPVLMFANLLLAILLFANIILVCLHFKSGRTTYFLSEQESSGSLDQ